MKRCTKCMVEKEEKEFPPAARGLYLASWCRACKRVVDREYRAKRGQHIGEIGRPPRPPEERFLSKVEIDIETGCWEWQGFKDKDGYGRFRIDPSGSSMSPAMRAAYLMFIGPIYKNEEACHTCDNNGCANPDHAFKGTKLENEQDKTRKKRRPRGEQHWNYKKGQYVDYKEQAFKSGEPTMNHIRWHKNRGVTNHRCPLCKEEAEW